MVVTKTSWNNTSATAQLNAGDDIGEAIGAALGSVPASKSGTLQIALRLQRNETVDIAEGVDLASLLASMFAGMQSQDAMQMSLDFNIIHEEDTADMSDANVRRMVDECVQFIGKDQPQAEGAMTPGPIVIPPLKKGL